jgi:glycerol-3-phosphate dehydrogenase (NAD(P)+)
MLMGEVVAEVLRNGRRRSFYRVVGAEFRAEVALGLPTAIVVASSSPAVAHEVQERFAGERLRVYTSDDPVGVELGGALKNVIAIAAGACEGLGYGHNSRAAR